MDKIRNEYIRGTPQVGRFGKKTLRGKIEVVWVVFTITLILPLHI